MDILVSRDSLQFVRYYNRMQNEMHQVAVSKGFHDKPVEDGTRLALIHSEVSEVLEALRKGNPPDDKVPEFTGEEAELADVVIRVMDYAGAKGLRIAEAIVAKSQYNKTREKMHGKKF